MTTLARAPIEYQTIKINRATRQRLRILAAHNNESMIDLIDRLVTQEEQRLAKKEKAR